MKIDEMEENEMVPSPMVSLRRVVAYLIAQTLAPCTCAQSSINRLLKPGTAPKGWE